MSSRYEDFLLQIVPTWLQAGNAAKFGKSMVQPVDELVEQSRHATEARFMLNCHESVLARIGAERRLPRYTGETTQQYRERLWDAWTAYQEAGTDSAVVRQLKLGTGITSVVVKDNAEWASPGGPPDGDTNWWSRFWLIVYNPNWTAWDYDDGGSDDYGTTTKTYGSTATYDEVRGALRLVRKWKPAHARFMKMYVVFNVAHVLTTFGDNGSFDPHAAWDPYVILGDD